MLPTAAALANAVPRLPAEVTQSNAILCIIVVAENVTVAVAVAVGIVVVAVVVVVVVGMLFRHMLCYLPNSILTLHFFL